MIFLRSSAPFAFALTVLLLPACTGKSSPAPAATKVVHFTLSDDIKGADPATVNDVVSAEIMGNIFETLMTFTYLGAMDGLEPQLAAAAPKFSEKNLVATFQIKKGVRFQDDAAFPNGKGREVVADDFIYAIKRLGDPANQSSNRWMFDGVVRGLNEWRSKLEKSAASDKAKVFDEAVEGLVAPDAHTLIIKLKRPYPQLLQILAMSPAAPIAREVVVKYGPEIVSHPVGTGAFRLKAWIRGSKITLEKNPTFRGETYPSVGSAEDKANGLLADAGKALPMSDALEWDIIKEEQPAWLKFRRGELDEVKIPKDNFAEAIGADGNLRPELTGENARLVKAPSLTAWWLEFNLKDATIGKNLKLRQALAVAFDRARALQLLYNDRGMLATSPIPPAVRGGDTLGGNNSGGKDALAYDLARAKTLLADAGFKDGKGLPPLSFDLRGPGVTQRQLGELLKDNFEKIGVRLNILANSFPEALEKQKTGRYQIMLGGWAGDYPDAENYLQNFYGPNAAPGTNGSNFKDPEFDKLYEQVRSQSPGPARDKAVARMVMILQEQLPIAPFFHQVEYRLVKKWLKNYKLQLLLWGRGKFYDVDTALKASAGR